MVTEARSQTVLGIIGTGAALPGAAIDTPSLLAAMAPYISVSARSIATRVARRLRIRTRHLSRALHEPVEGVRAEHSAPRLAASAVRQALLHSSYAPETLGFLIGHTATPHTLLPSNTAWTADELRYGGPHTELRQACTGFAAALLFARGLLAQGTDTVAIVGSETGSVYLDPRRIDDDLGQMVNLVQMGDGAGAIVLSSTAAAGASTLSHVFYGSIGLDRAPGLALHDGGSNSPAAAGGGVPHFRHSHDDIKALGMELLAQCLHAAVSSGIDPRTVDWFIPHQANGRMADLCASHLQLPSDRVFCEADAVGNLGSAAIWVALDRLRRSGRLAIGDRVLILGAEATKYLYGGFLYVHGNS